MTKAYVQCKCGNILLVEIEEIRLEQWAQPQELLQNKYRLGYCNECYNYTYPWNN